MQKVLIINYQGIGNTILMMPFFMALKNSQLFQQIDMSIKNNYLYQLTNNESIFDNYIVYKTHGNYGKIQSFLAKLNLIIQIRKTHYDLIINMDQAHNFSSMFFMRLIKGNNKIGINVRNNFLNTYDNCIVYECRTQSEKSLYTDIARKVDIEIPHSSLPIFLSNIKKEKSHFKEVFNEGISHIVIHPGCGHALAFKKWPANSFSELIKKILFDGHYLTILGGPEEFELSKKILHNIDSEKCINLVGKTSIRETIDVFANANLLVTNDSGLMHLGASMGIPVVAIFGPTSSIKNYPLGTLTSIISSQNIELCDKRDNQICEKCKSHWDTDGTPPLCLQSISVKRVLDEVNKILN